ncbi:MAG: response regulator [Deltaproteobacteria bacterium]|nr:response regulator [Deltaproteobacteria bacterium]
MIVDDEPGIVELLSLVCKKNGWRPHATPSVAGARALLTDLGQLELAIIDRNLPDGSGIDLSREIRRQVPECEIIICTAEGSLQSAIEAIDVGAFDYVQKPIDNLDAFALRLRSAADKVQLRRRLDQSEERYRAAFFAAFDAMLVVDEGRILEVNHAATELFGVPEDHLRGTPFAQLVPNESMTFEGDATIKDARGAEKRIEIVRSRVMIAGKAAMLYTLRDMTARYEAERHKERLERTLREARTMEALGRLASGVAHDFNNLLSVILASAELLQMTPPVDPAVQQSVSDILSAGRSAADLTQRILAFGRGARRRAGSCDVAMAVTQLSGILRASVGQVNLAVTLADGLGSVGVDNDELGQILMNLVVNARDACADGGHIVIAATRADLDAAARLDGVVPGAYVVIKVTDDGKGMAPDVLERIFEPYFTTKLKGKGNGLGLSTVYGIVKNRGGLIQVQSEVGKGTTFSVHLPAAS